MFKQLGTINLICLFVLFAQIGCSAIGYIDTIEPVESAGWIEAKPYSSFKSYLHKCDTFEIRIGYLDIEEGMVAFGPPILPIFPGPEPVKEGTFEINVHINNKKFENEFYKTSISLILPNKERIEPDSFKKYQAKDWSNNRAYGYFFNDLSKVDKFKLIFNNKIGGCDIQPLGFIKFRHSGYLPLTGPHQ